MKKALLIISLLPLASFAEELVDFEQIKSTLLAGKTIHIGIDFISCSPTSDVKQHHITSYVGLFTPNQVMISSDGTIGTGFKFFTTINPEFLNQPIYEVVNYTIQKDNNVQLTEQVFNPKYEALTEIFSFNCKIGTGARFYG